MKVAIVGSGVSGLGAAWSLSEHGDGHEVHLYEADPRPGGHANTVDFSPPGKSKIELVPVDTGFVSALVLVPGYNMMTVILLKIVLNPVTYPNFLRFLKLKDVALSPTEMTFSVSRDWGRFEWAGGNLFSVFCQPFRLLDPHMWRLIYDVLRFNACARRIVLDDSSTQEISIGQYLQLNGYSSSFRDNYLIPMTAAVWSTSPDKCTLNFPVRTLVKSGPYTIYAQSPFTTVNRKAVLADNKRWKVYVDKIVSGLEKDHTHFSTRVTCIRTLPTLKVQLETSDGSVSIFDHVILACHSDTALEILRAGNISTEEEHILGKFRWNKNEAVLHSDTKLMPRSRLAWSCWNYLSSSEIDKFGNYKANIDQVALTYWMNDLQHISEKNNGPIFVTLNPPFEPQEETIAGRWAYEHPVLNLEVLFFSAMKAQEEMQMIQNTRGISFAGAYLRYGFHEDGFTSGLRAAEHLGVKLPFEIEDPDREVSNLWISYVFDLLELSGARTVVGFLFSCVLFSLRFTLGRLIDLSFFDL